MAPGTPAFMEAFISRDKTKASFSFSVPAGKKMGHGFINATGGFVPKSGSNNLGDPTPIDFVKLCDCEL